jgi:hypothetical protein
MSLKQMETELYDRLVVLKDTYHCEGIKSEFENEGSDYRDLILLRYLTAKTGLKMYIKIGGVEAFTDLKMAIHLTADGVVIPMVESPFALIKSQNMIEDLFQSDTTGFDAFINIETKTAVEKLDDIFSIITPVIKGVTIGRSDLSYSYGIRGQQDNAFTNGIVEEIIDKAHLYGINKVTVGGGISKKTFENKYLIDKIIPKLACIETRNVIFKSEAIHDPKALISALDFEREYLNYKLAKNNMFIKMDENRFDTLMARG